MTKLGIYKVLFILYFLNYGSCSVEEESSADFLVFTVASHATDGYRDFIRSADYYNISKTVLGFGKAWEGGNMRSVGGGYKINLLKEALSVVKNERKIVLFTDSYDVLFLSDAKMIVNSFKEFDAEIVFAAEVFCWPDSSLIRNYSNVEGYRFLNSGGFIGYSDSLYKLLSTRKIENFEDDQLFYSLLYLNSTIRNELKLKLDHKANIFQNLFGAVDDVNLKVTDDGIYYLVNERYNTFPKILHGNSLSKEVEFRLLSNYLAGSWSQKYGCTSCLLDTLDWENTVVSNFPVVVIGIFIDRSSPFLDEFFYKIVAQNYPKKKIHLFIQNNAPFHNEKVEDFVSYYDGKYQTIKLVPHEDDIDFVTIRNRPMDYCVLKSCDIYLYLESSAHLDNPETLTRLIEQNRNIIAPLLVRPYKAWSNFWGALDKGGFYKRSFDYMDIVNNVKRGLWNVPYINSCYLIKADIIKSPELRPSYSYKNWDCDMSFCSDSREKGIYMYVDNQVDYGHLVDLDIFDPSRTNPEIYELFSNRWDWENRYLHPEYKDNFNPENIPEQPCPDVYWFPIVTPRFCKEFIQIMEAYGKWSDGSHNDERLKGGYEAVPTRDIHMNQVGLDDHWLQFLKLYIVPLQELVFIGYVHPQPRSLMNFVVRYRPDEQPSLKPHHDSSTYTINIALNRPNVDYQGGGCKFLRYNCSITNMRLGWTLMHPGRLTHYHEGLLVTNGTRYIMISFVDP